MSKINKILAVIFLLTFGFFAYLPQTTFAATCTFTYYDSKDLSTSITPNQNMDKLIVNIKSADFSTETTFRVLFFSPAGGLLGGNYESAKLPFDPDTGIILEFNKPPIGGWQQGNYNLYLIKSGASFDKNSGTGAACSVKFPISEISAQSSCKASIPTKPIEPSTEVMLHIEGLAVSKKDSVDIKGTGGYDIIVNNKFKLVYSQEKKDQPNDINLGNAYDAGDYTVEVKNRCGFVGTECSGTSPRLQCNPVGFRVRPKGSDGESGEIAPFATIPTHKCLPLQPGETFDPKVHCISSQSVERCPVGIDFYDAVPTAIGCIHTKPAEFVKDFLRFIIGISGGLAFLMMLIGAFQMLSSAGNPDRLNAGKERLQSAIIGLLFVIFAVLLLQIIGIGILAIPGFK